jgi:signal transduction histidine kinase
MQASPLRETGLSIGIGLSILAIFVFDIIVAPDDVSIAFMYTIPIFASIIAPHRSIYGFAMLTTALSLAGLVTMPPDAGISFYVNRTIAILMQWIAAALVTSRRNTEQLLHQNLHAEQLKTERQRRFLDIASHEIGTSLTTIDGQAFRLARRRAVIAPAEMSERSGKIRGAVRHIQALIRHIQLVAEVEDEAFRLQHTDVSLAAVIDNCVAHVKETYPQAAITVDTAALPATLKLDSFMICQIIENIVSNAAKYSPPGASISIAGSTDGDHAILIVTDKGRGIPADDLENVFAVYYRAQNSHDVHGTGVGLYVAERFTTAHGGTIAIDSQLGVGTKLTLRLPLMEIPL